MKDGKHELTRIAVSDRPAAVLTPEHAATAFDGMFDDRRECFMALYVDSRHRPCAEPYVISVGAINASLVHPREVLRPAIEAGAVAFIVAHNHPSGNAEPSGDDMDLTGRLDRVGELLGIALLDHVIFGSEGHVSIREYGWPRGGPCDD